MELTKQQELYINNVLKINEILYELTDNEIKAILKPEKELRDETLREIANVMLEYQIKDEVLNLTEAERIKLNKKLENHIKSKFKLEGEIENKSITDLLKAIAEDKYYLNTFNLTIGLDFTIKKVSENILNGIIKDTVKGIHYSDRIWKNKDQIAKVLQKEINDFLNGKSTVNEISKIIKDIFNSNAYNTDRLVRTEMCRVMELVNEQWAKDNDVEYQLFSAVLDGKTSKRCGELDGNVYEFNDKNKPIPPLHPLCRSSLLSMPDKEWRPKTRMDNATKEFIDYKTYKDWKNENKI
ncbi:MAG: minor capsid protein [Peptostreptococcaceae bacterium]